MWARTRLILHGLMKVQPTDCHKKRILQYTSLQSVRLRATLFVWQHKQCTVHVMQPTHCHESPPCSTQLSRVLFAYIEFCVTA